MNNALLSSKRNDWETPQTFLMNAHTVKQRSHTAKKTNTRQMNLYVIM